MLNVDVTISRKNKKIVLIFLSGDIFNQKRTFSCPSDECTKRDSRWSQPPVNQLSHRFGEYRVRVFSLTGFGKIL